MPTYNKRFSKQALNKEDFHRKINQKVKLEEVFCYRHVRVLQNDRSIQYKYNDEKMNFKEIKTDKEEHFYCDLTAKYQIW